MGRYAPDSTVLTVQKKCTQGGETGEMCDMCVVLVGEIVLQGGNHATLILSGQKTNKQTQRLSVTIDA